ncbi:protein NOI4-like isoform X2 [Gastrolobium bilobum]|uniref:protein NOI4-like isoform X2 n=1 Tax=Gastrolobium bilobum TaxID=150636 RepID=UPI002AB20FEA|nr:protein NOI4-like isoform X2 [Gastrolobium bilobum]
MASEKGRPLPKFGEWDVNNPASAEGFTVIFNKARDEKKTNNSAKKIVTPSGSDLVFQNKENYPQYPRKSKWFCCG